MSFLCLGLAVTSLTATENLRRCPVRQMSSMQVHRLKNNVSVNISAANYSK
jgi:hypothetical protein